MPSRKRDLLAFWLLGLCNNFAYVIMLSAAHDILKEQNGGNKNNNGTSTTVTTAAPPDPHTEYLQCNPISTGAILLANILPTLIIKLTAPFYIHLFSYRVKFLTVLTFVILSFILVGLSQGIWMSILGVICASICGGLGEVTFLSLTSFYDKSVVSTYSSGTGGAGLFGALAYAGLTTGGLSPKHTVLVMLVMPVTMAISYFLILTPPRRVELEVSVEDDSSLLLREEKSKSISLTWKQKLKLVLPLLKYMIPLMIVYFAEYFINQGLHEILYFNDIWLSKSEQYRWYQVDYQLGVFISRSSVSLFEINKLGLLALLQVVNMVLFILQVFYQFITNIWIVLAIVLYEGLLGGAAFVNTFYKISKEVEPEHKEFSIGVATMADSIGITLAGIAAIPSHNHICSLKLTVPN